MLDVDVDGDDDDDQHSARWEGKEEELMMMSEHYSILWTYFWCLLLPINGNSGGVERDMFGWLVSQMKVTRCPDPQLDPPSDQCTVLIWLPHGVDGITDYMKTIKMRLADSSN